MKQTGSCLKWMEISFFLCVFAFSTSTCHSLPWIKFAFQTFQETALIRKFLRQSSQEIFIAGPQREGKGRT